MYLDINVLVTFRLLKSHLTVGGLLYFDFILAFLSSLMVYLAFLSLTEAVLRVAGVVLFFLIPHAIISGIFSADGTTIHH